MLAAVLIAIVAVWLVPAIALQGACFAEKLIAAATVAACGLALLISAA